MAKRAGRTPDPLRTPRNRRQWVLVSYDLPDDKRRHKLMKLLAGYGQRVQYSVFECDLRPAQVEELRQRIRDLIDGKQDDVRIYPLCESCLRKVQAQGKARLHRHRPSIIV